MQRALPDSFESGSGSGGDSQRVQIATPKSARATPNPKALEQLSESIMDGLIDSSSTFGDGWYYNSLKII